MSEDALHLERTALHRTRCADCRIHAEREEEIRRSILNISARGLDDVARARIQARLAGDFDRIAAERVHPRRVPRSLIAAVIAAALILLWLWPREAIEPVIQEAPRFHPFLVAGTREAQLAPTEVLEAGEGMIVRAAIDRGDVTLIGPGRAVVREVIELEGGTLLVHVDRPLTVRARDLTVHVLGTRFAVAADRVSVREGRVEVVRGEARVRLSAGEAWPDGAPDPRLEARELAPPTEPSGIVVIGGTPAGAVAILDGAVLGPTPLIARLSAGEHQLEVQADLHRSHSRSIAVAGGGIAEVSFALDPLPKQPPRRAKPKAAPPIEDAESLYRRAEQSLAAQRLDEAVAMLEDLVSRFPDDPLAQSALYELARIDHQQGDLERAHARLIRLLEQKKDFTEPGQRLLCEIDVETSRYDDANACWRSFRERFPSSVHDAEALASLIGLAHVWNDCTRVKALAEEFLSKYPEHALVGDVRARLARCD